MEYKATLHLPKTDFPMKADLPKREPALFAAWEQAGMYAQSLESRRNRPVFHLHDGPPFANGDAHMGHALNMTLKDIVLKSKTMSGFQVPFVPGWDCHGLPIEHKVMKELGEEDGGKLSNPLEIRRRCAEYARKYIGLQRGQFKRLGVFGDWENPYLTMDPAYEAEILRLFAALVEKGLVYQALRPVYWSTGCQTALAEAEVDYASRKDPAIFVQFPLVEGFAERLGLRGKASLLIWTTTPWTLPANLAVAASSRLEYVAVERDGAWIVAARELLGSLPGLSAEARAAAQALPAGLLDQVEYRHPFLERTGKVHFADFVSADAGTGLVHIAPGHGTDDYQLGKRVGLEPFSPVDDRGCLTGECGVPELAGQYVFKANPLVIRILRDKGCLWAEQEYEHDYPHCWRSKTPIVFRSVTQWFIRVDAFRQEALDAIERVDWVPAWGKNRIRGAVESRPDWCISRQRTWGVPIPVFYEADGKALLDPAAIRSFATLVETEGTDAWFRMDSEELAAALGLPAGLAKGHDTLDVWIDSGSSHAAVVRKRLSFPADLYLEGSDQHRGWFQSSLLTSVAATGEAPFKQVLTNGFVVDLDGKKLSKSNGYQKPADLLSLVDKFGADILRLWVASQDYRDDVPFSEEIFKRVADTYRSVRNTLRILLANTADFDPAADAVPVEKLDEIDLYILSRLQDVVAQCRKAYGAYEFHQVYQVLNRFCAVDLSALYIDATKDRLYCDGLRDLRRRSTQTVMREVLETLCKLAAPITPYTAEEAWQYAGAKAGEPVEGRLARSSVHLECFPEPRFLALADGFEERWKILLEVREKANEQLEKMRQAKEIGKSLEAEALLEHPSLEEKDGGLLKELLIVSGVEVRRGDFQVSVRKASGGKCVRCWTYSSRLGSHAGHPELCPRCTDVLTRV
jgi:isoleucyl-tRNA synthetase